MGGQKPLACLNDVVLRLLVDKVLRSEDSELLLIVLVISQERVASRVKIVYFCCFCVLDLKCKEEGGNLR